MISIACVHTLCTCVHTLHKKKHKNIGLLKNSQSYMHTYPLQQPKQKQHGLLPKLLVLHVHIPSTKTQE